MTVSGRAPDPAAPAIPPADGMVWIPGATFAMGSDRHYPEEAPAHPVTVSGVLDRSAAGHQPRIRPVRAQDRTCHRGRARPHPDDYPGARPEMLVPFSAVFVAPGHRVSLARPVQLVDLPSRAPTGGSPRGRAARSAASGTHPVVHIAYSDAEAYATWADKSLPTEAEWEFAARGGLDGATYAWGEELMPDGKLMANYWQGTFPHLSTKDGSERTTPVGSFPPNAFGLYDMIGNVWEWTSDWYASRHSTAAAPGCCHPINPRGAMQLGESRPGSRPSTVDTAKSDQGRIAPVRGELLPTIPARRAHGPGHRHLHQPPRAPAGPAHARTCLTGPVGGPHRLPGYRGQAGGAIGARRYADAASGTW